MSDFLAIIMSHIEKIISLGRLARKLSRETDKVPTVRPFIWELVSFNIDLNIPIFQYTKIHSTPMLFVHELDCLNLWFGANKIFFPS